MSSSNRQLTISFTLDVDVATTTISTLKHIISTLGQENFQLTFEGHELQDARTLEYYGIRSGPGAHGQEGNTLRIGTWRRVST